MRELELNLISQLDRRIWLLAQAGTSNLLAPNVTGVAWIGLCWSVVFSKRLTKVCLISLLLMLLFLSSKLAGIFASCTLNNLLLYFPYYLNHNLANQISPGCLLVWVCIDLRWSLVDRKSLFKLLLESINSSLTNRPTRYEAVHHLKSKSHVHLSLDNILCDWGKKDQVYAASLFWLLNLLVRIKITSWNAAMFQKLDHIW